MSMLHHVRDSMGSEGIDGDGNKLEAACGQGFKA